MSAYATLEEAFGVRSFVAPQPPVLRGDVAQINAERYKRIDADIQQAHESSLGTRATVQPPRLPVEANKCGVIAEAHAQGGAQAAWNLIPKSAKCDMMWYAVREFIASDFVVMLLVGVCLYVLMR